MSAMLDAALDYAADGIPVFPCGANKKPLTKHGFKDASTDRVQITRWWTTWPGAMIGMPTGPKTGVVVLDLDTKNGKNGFESVPDWEQLTSVRVRTQSGGAHCYFKDDGGVYCTTDKIALGVDTRGGGGYVILPPSPGYAWVDGHDFSSLSPFPEHLKPPAAERLRPAAAEYIIKLPDDISEGTV
jgi:Bifunctional DNA primase/polymerase, N-terminal